MSTTAELLRMAREQLTTPDIDDAALESQVLLAHVIERDRSWLFAHPEAEIPEDMTENYHRHLACRAAGTPIAHLLGYREFWSRRVEVTADTLIPRPETEHLVETALSVDVPATAHALDLGTGSGAIALALAAERPGWDIVATDRSTAALAVARRNADRLAPGRLVFRHGDWFDALQPSDGPFDLIVGNPPYVASGDPHLRQGDLRYEPASALVSGADGLDDITAIIGAAPAFLAPRGWLWLEHGADQEQAVAALLKAAGFRDLRLVRDLAGHPRHSGGRRA